MGDQLLRDVVIVCLSALVISLALSPGKSPSPRLRREAKERRRGRTNTCLAPSPSSPGTKHQNPPTNNTRQGLQPCMNCGWQTQFARTCSSPSSRFERSTPEPGEALPSPLDICLNNDYIARRKVYNQSVAKLLPAEIGAHDLARDWLEAERDGRIKGGTQRRSSLPEQATNSALLAPSAPGGIRARRGSVPAAAVRPRLARQHSDPLPTEAPASPTIRHAIPKNSQAAPPSSPPRSIGEPLPEEAPVPPAICDTSTRANAHAPPSTEAPPAMSQACYQAPQEPGPKKPSASKPAQISASAQSQSAPNLKFHRDDGIMGRPKAGSRGPKMPSTSKSAFSLRSASNLDVQADTHQPREKNLVAGCYLTQDRLPPTPGGLVRLGSIERTGSQEITGRAPPSVSKRVSRTQSASKQTTKHSSGTLFYSNLIKKRLSSADAFLKLAESQATSSGRLSRPTGHAQGPPL